MQLAGSRGVDEPTRPTQYPGACRRDPVSPREATDVEQEVHRKSVARQILHDYAPSTGEVPTEHMPNMRAAGRAQFTALLELATAND
jgi:hypothetical protein